jgi:SAM-dependent methyltransferase
MAHYELETVACPSCHSTKLATIISQAKELYNGMPDRFDVVKCELCEFVFTNPRPTPATMSYFYPQAAGYYRPAPARKLSHGFSQQILRVLLARDFGYTHLMPKGTAPRWLALGAGPMRYKILLQHTPRFVEGGRLLDIGCASGTYLTYMRDLGWKELYGVEMNAECVRNAREKHGLSNVIQGVIEDLPYADRFFDVVNLSMTLEHCYDPLMALRSVRRILKDSGQLILSVPDISGVEARLFKENFYGLQVPQHLNHFTPHTLKQFLIRAGFRPGEIVHHRFDRDLVASAGYRESPWAARFLSNPAIRKTLVKGTIETLGALGKTSRMSAFASPEPH